MCICNRSHLGCTCFRPYKTSLCLWTHSWPGRWTTLRSDWQTCATVLQKWSNHATKMAIRGLGHSRACHSVQHPASSAPASSGCVPSLPQVCADGWYLQCIHTEETWTSLWRGQGKSNQGTGTVSPSPQLEWGMSCWEFHAWGHRWTHTVKCHVRQHKWGPVN